MRARACWHGDKGACLTCTAPSLQPGRDSRKAGPADNCQRLSCLALLGRLPFGMRGVYAWVSVKSRRQRPASAPNTARVLACICKRIGTAAAVPSHRGADAARPRAGDGDVRHGRALLPGLPAVHAGAAPCAAPRAPAPCARLESRLWRASAERGLLEGRSAHSCARELPQLPRPIHTGRVVNDRGVGPLIGSPAEHAICLAACARARRGSCSHAARAWNARLLRARAVQTRRHGSERALRSVARGP